MNKLGGTNWKLGGTNWGRFWMGAVYTKLSNVGAPFMGAFVLDHTSSSKLFLLSGVVGLCSLLGIRRLVNSSLSIVSSA
ncbi:hypothetical protein [Bartonella queenslandensis]|uniref:hypothetical protein n=1 Tax=Bartonella queenslandensis TaxID=481138 RepID=UPI0005851BFB|nr:hypothetical protein [Bartonella queenslandensis]